MRLFASMGVKYRSGHKSAQPWTKSSLSYHNGNCVEVAGLTEDVIRIRDSKKPRGPILRFTPAEWDAFIGGVQLGEFNRKPQ